MDEFSMEFVGLNKTLVCLGFPLEANSHGIFANFNHTITSTLKYSLPLLELQILIILFMTHLFIFLLKPFGISTFLSCMLVGIILGPNGLGKFHFMREIIFPHDSQDVINGITNVGYIMYVFLAAVKTDLSMLHKVGRKALLIGICSALTPLIGHYTDDRFIKKGPLVLDKDGLQIIVIAVITSLPVVADNVDHLKLANTGIGRLALASGLVADCMGIMSFFIGAASKAKSLDGAMTSLLPTVVLLISLAFILRPGVNWVIRNTPEGKPLSMSLIILVIAMAFIVQELFTILELSVGVGPVLIGLALPAGAPVGTALDAKFGSFTNGVLIHILIPVSVMRADFQKLFITKFSKLIKSLILTSLFFVIKMFGCLAPCFFLKMPINEAVAVAFILSYAGVVQLRQTAENRDGGIFSDEECSFLIFYILLNAIIFPIIIKKLYNPSRKYDGHHTRNVLSLKPHSELKILTCIYGQDNAESSITLIDIIHPTKESPVDIYALHLAELIGRYVPLLVSHSKLKPISINTSQKIIYNFNQYEKNNWDSVAVQLFTSLSSFPLMHEEVINMAIEKKTSLIILPLHRRWSVHGDVESQGIEWRQVNIRVLEEAPCSVAIFFSRGSSLARKKSRRTSASYLSVCMIFFGGKDDREALILAKRMLKKSEVTLTVHHFLPKDGQEVEEPDQDHMYDAVLIDDIKQMAMASERLEYRSHVVEDGPQTILMVRSMMNDFEMFIIGRRYGVSSPQTSGLTLWSELPELGVIGDIFASKELETRASVLVVQQQKKLRN